jgi:transcriptional regulator
VIVKGFTGQYFCIIKFTHTPGISHISRFCPPSQKNFRTLTLRPVFYFKRPIPFTLSFKKTFTMYIPSHYRQNNRDEILKFIQRFSFGTIITASNGLPVATHLPFVIESTGDNLKLLSHFARANKQWEDITRQQVLVIFSEPHAYVSPAHYENLQNVPTWNYMAVHAYGKAQLWEDPARVSGLLEQTINNYEPGYLSQWKSLPAGYQEKMIRGIVAFEINVTELQAKEKLSQNKKDSERARIADTLLSGNHSPEKLIGEYMHLRNNHS